MTRLSFPLQEHKRGLRAEARERRRSNASLNASLAEKLADVFIDKVSLGSGAIVAVYSPVHDEIDPSALVENLRDKGHPLALPVMTRRREPLVFRRYEDGDQLLLNPLGIAEPMSQAGGVDPDVLLVPLLAFDRKRNRLGYGGGYYDRTIKVIRAKKQLLVVGLAYSYQEIQDVPTGVNDVPMDIIVTDAGVI